MVVRRTGSALRKQVGQLLIIGFDGTAVTQRVRNLLERVQPAGVILFARNIVDAQQTHQLLKDCRAAVKHPIFTCVDMEGGQVDRLRDVFGPTPSAAEVFASGEPRLFRKHGQVIGQACRTIGFNVDFAPVVDLAFPASQKVMGSRAVSALAGQVTLYARSFLEGLRSKQVLGVLKHFPGLGETDLDTHHELPTVDKSWERLWAEDLVPYRNLRHESPLVLVGHASYPAVTQNAVPASVSRRWISNVLRAQIGYHGLVISDDLEMGAVLRTMAIEDAAVAHIRAGGDLCLICHREENVICAYETLRQASNQDADFAKYVVESVRRVLALKKQKGALMQHAPTPSATKVRRLSLQLWEFTEEVRLRSIRRQAEA
jgi:beta-N-acetylhexosaminidase